jgi:hypothetical protein
MLLACRAACIAHGDAVAVVYDNLSETSAGCAGHAAAALVDVACQLFMDVTSRPVVSDYGPNIAAIRLLQSVTSDALTHMQKYKHLYSVNEKTSHYLLSKVYRAKEALDQERPEEAAKWKEKDPPGVGQEGGATSAHGSQADGSSSSR